MHATTTHPTIERVSRRGHLEASLARHTSSVQPCLHTTLAPIDTGR